MTEIPAPHFVRLRLRNLLHSVMLIGGMTLLLGFAAWLLLGAVGGWLVAIFVATLVLTSRISSRLILRLYRAQELSPAQAPAIYDLLNQLSHRAELGKLPRLHYIASSVPAAFTTGTSSRANIALTDGLLRRLTLRELAAVIAHEVSHIRHRDIWLMSLADSITRTIAMLSLPAMLILLAITPALLLSGQPIPLVPILLFALTPHLSILLQLALSRTREYDADLGAIELTHDPDALISALTTLDRPHPAWLRRFGLVRQQQTDPSLLRSHPPTSARVRRLQALLPPASNRHPLFANQPWELPKHHFPPVRQRPRHRWPGIWY